MATAARAMQPSLLVIDDSEEARTLLRAFLERHGYEVKAAASSEEGLALFHDSPTDAVIIDILMPEKGGLETIVELRDDRPDVKLIAVSGGFGKSTDQDRSLAEAIGVDRTCSKPFATDHLLQTIREVLGHGD